MEQPSPPVGEMMPRGRANHNPLLKEGMPRRSKIVMLPQVIGAAGVVSLSFSYSFTNCFEHRLDVEQENHNAFRLQETRPLDLILHF